ncbi:ABC transporter ATP-binding protein [Ferroacidibacillus organovorans]|uniref:ABC transporter ATP-binding protein n=1 Tax=Ferroacidibacillus organovorans TaxID=1765683 RepID=A0A162T2D6_9BACL|nr:ABC transporter ATP-binding protein [Ferroacidibacillus organovorans]KYP80391.1 ABC transporter ATP-binding protein [Ferroacidibacillus organovorans]OAG93167.1 ABC transporter ATP-binding protein [Ferroacidibacillus organovorans]OPG17263.1 ABC transporter ATP-binding protein [Ferroacidibacillus organovorans]
MFLEFDEVTLRFSGLVALKGVSLTVNEGGIFAIIGPNGAGKSTMLNCLSRIYTPQQGAIRFLGENLLRVAPDRIKACGIGRSFQNMELFSKMTVEDNLLVGYHCALPSNPFSEAVGWYKARSREREARERVQRVLESLGIASYSRQTAGNLPYGIQKKVDVGRALMGDPRLLLLDEPAAGLNELETEELGHWISDIKRAMKTTVVMIEHDMNLVMSISDRIAVLDFGELIAVGTPVEIRQDERVIRAYLGQEA